MSEPRMIECGGIVCRLTVAEGAMRMVGEPDWIGPMIIPVAWDDKCTALNDRESLARYVENAKQQLLHGGYEPFFPYERSR